MQVGNDMQVRYTRMAANQQLAAAVAVAAAHFGIYLNAINP